MEPDDKILNQEKKIKNLELELNDLRQGLTVVADYYRDLRQVSRQQVATEIVDQDIARPIVDEDREFEGIWRFHEEVLVPDPRRMSPAPPCSRRLSGIAGGPAENPWNRKHLNSSLPAWRTPVLHSGTGNGPATASARTGCNFRPGRLFLL